MILKRSPVLFSRWNWSVELHRKLLADDLRTEVMIFKRNDELKKEESLNFPPIKQEQTFTKAFKKLIKPKQSVVIDIGSGTGFLSFLASKVRIFFSV